MSNIKTMSVEQVLAQMNYASYYYGSEGGKSAESDSVNIKSRDEAQAEIIRRIDEQQRHIDALRRNLEIAEYDLNEALRTKEAERVYNRDLVLQLREVINWVILCCDTNPEKGSRLQIIKTHCEVALSKLGGN